MFGFWCTKTNKLWNTLLGQITQPQWCVLPHTALFFVVQKNHSTLTLDSQEKPLHTIIIWAQSYFKQLNKAWSLVSLSGISSPQSQQLQHPIDEAEPWGVLVYNIIDENTLILLKDTLQEENIFNQHHMAKIKANRDKECGSLILTGGICCIMGYRQLQMYCWCIIHASITSPLLH